MEVFKMNSGSTRTHIPIPAPYPPKDHFDYTLPKFGEAPDATNPKYWGEVCRIVFYAGTTLYLWNEATELKIPFLSACAIEEGQTVLLISKYGEESGLAPALKSLLGEKGRLTVEEIGQQALDVFRKAATAPKPRLQWNFNQLNSLPDKSIDRVILFGAASHVVNWSKLAKQVNRVLRDGGRIVIADAPMGGNKFRYAMHLDAHFEGFILKALSAMGIEEKDLPDVNPEDLRALFEPLLRWSRIFSWQGLYLFYGQKGGNKDEPALKSPKPTKEVQTFLSVAPYPNLWDILAQPEKAIWGKRIAEIKNKWAKGPQGVPYNEWARDLCYGAINLNWMWHNNRNITDIMWGNLRAYPGDKVMIIGESCEQNEIQKELGKRIGKSGEMVLIDMIEENGCDFEGWQAKRKAYLEKGCTEEWPYDFADNFPDNYFDVLFIPQGVHHSNNWLRDASRLLRAVKPGGQVMAIECGLNRPEFDAALEESAFVRLIMARLFDFVWPAWLGVNLDGKTPLPPQAEHEGRPYHDVSTEHLREAFGDLLVDVNSIEWKGWILFWGYKK
jgi:ubiquinone/menaquinone biosynthesis C-methylase UbiE